MADATCLHCTIMDTITAWSAARKGENGEINCEFVIGMLADAMIECAMLVDDQEAQQALVAFSHIQIDAALRRYHDDLLRHRASAHPPTSMARN